MSGSRTKGEMSLAKHILHVCVKAINDDREARGGELFAEKHGEYQMKIRVGATRVVYVKVGRWQENDIS